uniref:GDNF receptor alpha-2 n=1 Tax=Sphaerodactylus townsendi TaxID=933632 RepID=A0ACB8EZ49_9SAUR
MVVGMFWHFQAAEGFGIRSMLGVKEPPGWRTPVDCVRANELCAAESSCSSRYRTLRQCVAGRDRNTMLANKECQAALEVLQESPLYDCHCKRGMKKELPCLQIYWSIHLGLTGGKDAETDNHNERVVGT